MLAQQEPDVNRLSVSSIYNKIINLIKSKNFQILMQLNQMNHEVGIRLFLKAFDSRPRALLETIRKSANDADFPIPIRSFSNQLINSFRRQFK